MYGDDKNLLKKLLMIIAIKVAAITAIWWLFLADMHTEVDSEDAGSHILSTALSYDSPYFQLIFPSIF